MRNETMPRRALARIATEQQRHLDALHRDGLP
jgi:hypothetical protein